MTQEEIARQIGRSQPEVSRLLRFHGPGQRGMALRKHRTAILGLIKAAGGTNVRVFGSVATGQDREGSDIDLLVDLPTDIGLLTISRLEREVSEVVGMPVDIVPSDDLRPDVRERVLREAVAL